jgi:hypothetical protein
MGNGGAGLRWALVVGLTILAGVPATAVARGGALVLDPASLAAAGWHPVAVATASGRRELRSRLPRSLAKLVATAEVEAAAARDGSNELSSYAFVLSSAPAAHRVAIAFRRVHHGQALNVGRDGAVAQRGSGSATVFSFLFRAGARIGLLDVRAGTSDAGTAAEYAPLANARLSSALPATALAKILDQIRPDGSISKQTALQAFALSYGPLPGVPSPGGAATPAPWSGDLAGAWALRYRTRVSPRLRSMIDARLGFATGAGAHAAALFGDANFKKSAKLTAQANMWRDAEEAKLGKPLGLSIVAGVSSTPSANDSYPIDNQGHFSLTGPQCRIRIIPATANGSAAFLKLVLAHEVFHCFEFQTTQKWPYVGSWIIEGLADWAALTVTGVSFKDDGGFLDPYLLSPGIPVFARSYDAAGFWGHVQDTSGDLWSRIPTILKSTTNPAAFFVSGAETEQFLSTWASSQVRSATGGSEWQMKSPVPSWPSDKQLPVATLADSVDHLIDTVSPYATGHVQILVGPLVHIDVTGHARLSSEYNYTDLGNGWFCLEAGGCECPADSQGKVPDNQPLEPGAILALTGDPTDGATADIEAHTLKEFCSGVFVTEYDKAGCVACGAPMHTVLHVTDPGTCVLGSDGTLTVTLTGDGGGLVITVPGYAGLPKRSDGSTEFEFQAPRRGGPDVVMTGTDWSSGDFLMPDPGIQFPEGSGYVSKGGKDGFLAVSLQSPSVGDAAGRVAGGDFTCRKPVS